jgi:transcriptional regulator with XRE-family HTH domain
MATMTPRQLRTRMEANGVPTAYALAKLLGVSQSTAWRWLNGKRGVSVFASALVREKLPKDK